MDEKLGKEILKLVIEIGRDEESIKEANSDISAYTCDATKARIKGKVDELKSSIDRKTKLLMILNQNKN